MLLQRVSWHLWEQTHCTLHHLFKKCQVHQCQTPATLEGWRCNKCFSWSLSKILLSSANIPQLLKKRGKILKLAGGTLFLYYNSSEPIKICSEYAENICNTQPQPGQPEIGGKGRKTWWRGYQVQAWEGGTPLGQSTERSYTARIQMLFKSGRARRTNSPFFNPSF